MKIGIIFPGQGAQFLGMGKEFYDQERIVQELFEQASSCLDQNFVKLCFASSENELRKTVNAQTSIFLIGASIYSLINQKYGVKPDLVAGHSSGEYGALFAAKSLSFPDALYLLKKRSLFMEQVTAGQGGGMIAVIGVPVEVVEKICKRYDDPSDIYKVAQVVNFNTPSQLVISGTLSELEQIKQDLKSLRSKVIPLKVSGGFHSRLIQKIERDFDSYMLKVDFKKLEIPLVNNFQAKIITNPEELRASLVKQISSPVLWWQSMQAFKDFDLIIQIGPGQAFAKMLKREWPKKIVFSINTMEDVKNVLKFLGKDNLFEQNNDFNDSPDNIEKEEQVDL